MRPSALLDARRCPAAAGSSRALLPSCSHLHSTPSSCAAALQPGRSSSSGSSGSSSTPQQAVAAAAARGAAQQQQQQQQEQQVLQRPVERRHILLSLPAAAAATAGVLLQQWASPRQAAAAGDAPLTIEQVTPAIAPAGALSPAETSVINIFRASTPAVVTVIDTTLVGRGAGSSIPEVDVPEGNGSGIVWDTAGNIVTNCHVLPSVARAAPLGSAVPHPAVGKKVALVTLQGPDGVQRTFDATLVGADRARDLAVLRVSGVPKEQLRPLPLGSSAPGLLRVGMLCLAIGNPFGFDHTLTTGVISGLSRDIRSTLGGTIPGGIQTDAQINPGNSGGPLLDSAGRLIGVNTAIFTPTGTSVGVGFAIPVETVARVVPQLIASGRVLRPSLGIAVASEAVAAKLRVTQGALLAGVTPGGPAEAAGLLPTRRGLAGVLTGDVIVQLNGQSILNGGDLFNALERMQVGDEVTLGVLRSGDGGGQQAVDVRAKLAADAS